MPSRAQLYTITWMCVLEILRIHWQWHRTPPWLFKADVDAAFRRIPLLEAHKWVAGVAYLHNGAPLRVKCICIFVLFFRSGKPWVATHHAAPFGATASVVAWHRVGALIAALARKLLHIPVLRYVDDYFAPERCLQTRASYVQDPCLFCMPS